MVVIHTFVPGFRAAKTKAKRDEFLARAYIEFFSDFPIIRHIDMDEDEKLWFMEQKKKVRTLCGILRLLVTDLFSSFSAYSE